MQSLPTWAVAAAGVCNVTVAKHWPRLEPPIRMAMFAWNHKAGLGFIEADRQEPVRSTTVWLMDEGGYSTQPYDISYWRQVRPRSERAVEQVERLAFAEDLS